MNCQDIQQLLAFADRKAEELDQAEREALQHHLEKCPDCAEAARAERGADQARGTAMRDVPLPAGLKEKVLKRLAAERGGMPWKSGVAALAAMVLLAVGIGWYLRPLPSVTAGDLQQLGEFGRGMDEAQVEKYFADQGLKVEVPRDLEIQHLRQIGIVDFKGQRVAKLWYRNEADPGRPARAEVIILPHSQFRVDKLDDATVNGANLIKLQSGRFTYLIFCDGNFNQQIRRQQF